MRSPGRRWLCGLTNGAMGHRQIIRRHCPRSVSPVQTEAFKERPADINKYVEHFSFPFLDMCPSPLCLSSCTLLLAFAHTTLLASLSSLCRVLTFDAVLSLLTHPVCLFVYRSFPPCLGVYFNCLPS